MYTFLGLTILAGIVYKPQLSMYWSSDKLFETGIFGKSMARDRYLLMLHFLHFAENELIDPQDPNRDRLGKIREVLDLIRVQRSTVFQPGRDLCVDESLLLLSVTFMHSDYCARNPDRTVSYEVYHHAMKRLNISFSEPAADPWIHFFMDMLSSISINQVLYEVIWPVSCINVTFGCQSFPTWYT